jgi:anti-sigma factor RsiW
MQHLNEGTIHAWLDGALSPEEAAEVEAHIAGCPECAAKVAEARGFIAGASRILTALDDVPRGVIPFARPARRINQTFLKAAAAVLVVATGGLLVVRGRENIPTSASVAIDKAVDTVTPPMQTVATEVAPQGASTPVATPPKVAVGKTVVANSPPMRRVISPTQAPTTVAAPGNSLGGVASGVVTGTETTAQVLAPPTPPAVTVSPVLEQTRVARRDTTKLDFTLVPDELRLQAVVTTGVTSASSSKRVTHAEEPRLKVVRVEKIPGGTRTVFEISPGKNVVLSELDSVSRAAAVALVSPTMATRAGGAMSISSSASSTIASFARTDSSGVQWEMQSAPSIRWIDRAGKTVILSGFFSYEELQRVRARIERERGK